MKLKRDDLWSLEEYAADRESFRAMILKHKKVRQCPGTACHFTLRTLTMKYQIQEMLRVERSCEKGLRRACHLQPLIPMARTGRPHS